MAFSASAGISGQIIRVLGGDTVEVLEPDNQLTRVRLADIDAPEKSQPFSQRSRQTLSSMVVQRTVTSTDVDRYGRLGTVWLGRMDVNAAQIRSGSGPGLSVSRKCRQSTGFWSVPEQTEPWRWRSQGSGSINDAL